MDRINFYGADKAYGWLSNFWMSEIKDEGRTYASVEHYFQAWKACTEAEHELVRSQYYPGDAKTVGQRIKLRSDWDTIKNDVMLRALRLKFKNPELRKLLLKTGEAELFEASPTDSYWGTGADGQGLNWLGTLLMQVRDEIRTGLI